MKLKDKIALITGAAAPEGLGDAIAVAMANEGAKVAICDINEEGVTQRAKDIEAKGTLCPGLRCDVSSVESVQQMFARVLKKFGTVDILVNNAALVPTRPADEERRNRHYAYLTTPMPRQSLDITTSLTDDDWLRWWDVNVHGVFWCTREALKIMEPKKYGKIINIASTGGISTMSGHSPGYSASKAAVVSLTRTVALDVAGANIQVNCPLAGFVRGTSMPTWKRSVHRKGALFSRSFPSAGLGNPESMPRSRSIWPPTRITASGRSLARMAAW
jgi:3-oxoacyl-[acyl-carrier protein] reductase